LLKNVVLNTYPKHCSSTGLSGSTLSIWQPYSVAAANFNYVELSVAVDYELFFAGDKTTGVGAYNGKEKVESESEG
jgi:hypothetical protein